MDDNNLILCKYNKHETEVTNFNPSGLKGPYNICRACQNERKQKNRHKHQEAFNEHNKLYQRAYLPGYRERNRDALRDEYKDTSIFSQ
ncbi:MAG: hypothetical protein Hyperionvirus4_17 [Hyperionvirus sp.]|uniref:Uncharacterized protein n=1 Tax=Hyperionvirus sp. TaxID=2487770 RepID=A0A3G5A7N2_9VIRU|nr:MAG: hypothetical protein Hyperionvirus4_17 [Hyperionvirus sp.]